MPVRTRRTRRPLLAVVLVLLISAGFLLWPREDAVPEVGARDLTLELPAGPGDASRVSIDATLYTPERTPAPSILLAHGFGGSKDDLADQARGLSERGFVVLAYSARGFGASTGRIGLNSPEHEVNDARELITWLAGRPQVLSDGPDDPVVGVAGASYGGALALLLAGTDDRVDAIAPMITYNDLNRALLPNAAGDPPSDATTPAAGPEAGPGVFKQSWAATLFSAGFTPPAAQRDPADQDGETPPNEADDANEADAPAAAAADGPLTCGRFSSAVCEAYTELATTGRPSAETVELLAARSPSSVTGSIRVPTLLVQGRQDTLFGFEESDATAREIAEAGGTVRVIWYDGGHDAESPGEDLLDEVGDWFDFHLADRGPDPGTGFEYTLPKTGPNEETPPRTVTTDAYPGLGSDDGTSRENLRLTGDPTPVLTPPGGQPASVSSLPGLGIGALPTGPAGGLATDLPGQVARFTSEPLSESVLIAGSPRITLQVSAVPGQPRTGSTVLFVKLYDLGTGDDRRLPGGAVAPIRLGDLRADGAPTEVVVTLPGIVHTIDAGDRIEIAVATTDQAYRGATQPGVTLVGLGGDEHLSLPTVAGTPTHVEPPTEPLLGALAVMALGVAVAVVSAVRRRQTADFDPELADVPLSTEKLSKSYGGGAPVVSDLSIRVESGQVVGLLGPNGAGKTTTLRMLLGLISPSEGSVRVFGHLIRPGAPVLSRVGSFVEGAGFLPHLSGMDNLRSYWAATGRSEESARMEEALAIAGLGVAVHRKVGAYSQGMRQRLALAQAMLGMPDLLVLDEPANGLDPPQIHRLRTVLADYAATGRTVLVSSHLLAEVEQTCDHLVVMHRGRLVAAGPVTDIVAGDGEVTFVVDDPVAAGLALRTLRGVEEVASDEHSVTARLVDTPASAVVAALVAADVAVTQVGPRGRLEDTFLQLVGGETAP
ncbi:ABC-2 type transport system ATP-binding protein [Actinoalloteichus hoggarensis]|uniref:Putative ABC transporter ATP-binding protein YxlF n=1 Tax=Actinoalloteichus hoggarensis TaxID=1470176 RepID=A0A221W228_9PSEU|nr:alpha/beta fold hydrolase [Actinoalloteichus hoggarensis]ASO19651.1 putative ABC transporter ATP-binding protein YxlF [Actinoalloteichus hoggarensis]MBB5919642.1 ABC-2 type transport system ATP-binding protein [Actinoalloteichus hoggarensis]